MTKVVIKAGSVYSREYVVDMEDAMAIMNILKNAERFEHHQPSKYSANENKRQSMHVWPTDMEDAKYRLDILPEATYQLAKMEGKRDDS